MKGLPLRSIAIYRWICLFVLLSAVETMAQTDAVANTGGDSLSFRSLAIQVGMSAGLQLTFIVLFSLLRPKNNGRYLACGQ
jgi:hypothetical protein